MQGSSIIHLRHVEHQDLDAAAGRFDSAMNRLITTSDPPWPDVVVAVGGLSSFIAAYLPHMGEGEQTVMPVIWSTCSDNENRGCSEVFMAAVGEDENMLTFKPMFASLSVPELQVIVERCRMAGVRAESSALM